MQRGFLLFLVGGDKSSLQHSSTALGICNSLKQSNLLAVKLLSCYIDSRRLLPCIVRLSTTEIDLFDWFLDAFDFALQNGNVDNALLAWISLLDRTSEWAKDNPQWSKDATKICKEFLSSASQNHVCPCPNPNKKAFTAHFQMSHSLAVLDKRTRDPKDRKRRKVVEENRV
ncbi:hypothetical protein LOCC1_G008067 [Lachnellula occidentalis]|uniref:Uncharacterized protein n=1 Tax=Lachnellula occidentalis TaxID=215460 RepID=A0A8H8RVU8_9HELO|nr:hypothetical protein LOCC1_G008067 [Lachnellula occidentalis]